MPSKKKKPAGETEAAATPAPEPAAPAPAAPKAAPAPKAKAEAKAKPEAAPKAKGEAAPKAKGEAAPKAKAEAAPKGKAEAAPKAAAKAKGEAAPKAKAAAAAAPEPEPVAEPKAAAKKKPKAKAEPKAEAAPPANKVTITQPFEMLASEDAMGDEWEAVQGVSKKKQRQIEKKEQEKKEQQEAEKKAEADKKAAAKAEAKAKADAEKAAKAKAKAPEAKKPDVSAAELMKDMPAAKEPEGKKEDEPKPPEFEETITVPENRVGVVIGPKGAMLRKIQERCPGVTKIIPTTNNSFTIVGTNKQAVAGAIMSIKELGEFGYTSLDYEDFKKDHIMVAVRDFPLLIGERGAVVRSLKEALNNIQITFPDTKDVLPKDRDKKVKVELAGGGKDVDKCKETMMEIMTHYHSEITHPDVDHDEIEVPDQFLKDVIGRAGSEIRHIQNNYKVKVYIPNETTTHKKTLIVGHKDDVGRAKAYIVKMMAKLEERQKEGDTRGQGSAKDGDHWGQDEDYEDWMGAYMYKRKA